MILKILSQTEPNCQWMRSPPLYTQAPRITGSNRQELISGSGASLNRLNYKFGLLVHHAIRRLLACLGTGHLERSHDHQARHHLAGTSAASPPPLAAARRCSPCRIFPRQLNTLTSKDPMSATLNSFYKNKIIPNNPYESS